MNNTNYEWDIPLENTAYDESYRRGFAAYCAEVFADGTLSGEYDVDAGFGYTAKQHYYEKHITDISVKECSKWELIAPDGACIFRYDAPDGPLHQIADIGGERYYFYNDNLYGYNVLRLSDMAEYRYFPKGSDSYGAYPVRGDYTETFIWTEISYNEENHVMAVHGCYWGGPYEIMLYSIPDVMEPFDKLCYPLEFLDCDYYDTADKDPFHWEGKYPVINCCEIYRKEDDSEECDSYPSGRFVISVEDYMGHMHNVEV